MNSSFTPPPAARRIALVALAIAASTPGLAQEAASDGVRLEEVTVTARKVEENLMTVPLAITALSSRELEAANVKVLSDISRMTPSFHFENQTGGGSGRNDRSTNQLTFRGLFLSNNSGVQAGGQLFVDGAPVIGAQPPSIVDIERVEVLKGPQSAYFGRSTFVGAINFVTRDPSDEFKAKLSLEGSRWSSYDISGSVEGPLSETLSGRLTLRGYEQGGFYENAGDPGGTPLGKRSTNSAAASLVWRPNDSLKVKTFLNVFRDLDGAPAHGALKRSEFNGRVAADGSCVPFSQAPAGTAALGQAANSRASFGYWCGELPEIDQLPASVLSGDYDVNQSALVFNALYNPNPNWVVFDPNFKRGGGLRREAVQGDVRVDYEFANGYGLSALTAYHRDKQMTIADLNFRDNAGVTNPFYAGNPAIRPQAYLLLVGIQSLTTDWSQELRLTSPQENRLRWTLGANYFDASSPGGGVWGVIPLGPGFLSSITKTEVNTPATFGALYYDLTDSITIGAEARWQRDEIKQIPVINASGNLVTGAAAQVLQAKFNSVSPRVSIDWEYAPDSIVYALFSRGYRPGGFNSALVTANPATLTALQAQVPSAGLTYDEEQLDNYEVGIKSTWLDGRARTSLTLYKDKWKNGQVSNQVIVVLPDGTTNGIVLTINNGEADLQGVEFEGSLQVTRGLRLSGTFALNDTKIVSNGIGPGNVPGNCSECAFIYGQFTGVIGRDLPGTSRMSGSLSVDYTAPLTDSMSWYSRGDLLHSGKRYTDYAAATTVAARSILNGRVGLRGDHWSAEVFGTNLTDDKKIPSAYINVDAFNLFGLSSNDLRFAAPVPRAFGVRASYEF